MNDERQTITPKEVEKVLETLKLDLGAQAETPLGLEIIDCVSHFLEDKDLNWVDLAVWRITSENLPLPRTIQSLAAGTAYERLKGAGTRRQHGTEVFREHLRSLAMASMAALKGQGLTIEEAAEKAANALHAMHGMHVHMASSLESYFPKYLKSSPVGHALIQRLIEEAAKFPDEAKAVERELDDLPKRAPGSRR